MSDDFDRAIARAREHFGNATREALAAVIAVLDAGGRASGLDPEQTERLAASFARRFEAQSVVWYCTCASPKLSTLPKISEPGLKRPADSGSQKHFAEESDTDHRVQDMPRSKCGPGTSIVLKWIRLRPKPRLILCFHRG